jgi:arginyl-tRNA synthetase
MPDMPTLSTIEPDGLRSLLEGLSVSDPEACSSEYKVLSNPLEIFRASLAQLLSVLTACDIQDAGKSIQWPNNIYSGDLSVTVPRLRPGCKPAEISADVMNKAFLHLRNCVYLANAMSSFLQTIASLTLLCPMGYTCVSF